MFCLKLISDYRINQMMVVESVQWAHEFCNNAYDCYRYSELIVCINVDIN